MTDTDMELNLPCYDCPPHIIELYNGLMHLCQHGGVNGEESEVFSYVDYKIESGHTVRIFTYMLTAYSDWLLPYAKSSRGTAFMLDHDGNMLYLCSRTMDKFYNIYENPFTEYDIDTTIDIIDVVMDKEDGSLISTYITPFGDLRVKSHGSTESPHAKMSHRIIIGDRELQTALYEMASNGYTVNMEFVSPYPDFRIVLEYKNTDLIVLNIINNFTGEYLPVDQYPEVLRKRKVKSYTVEEYINTYSNQPYKPGMLMSEFVDIIRDLQNVEGVVMHVKQHGNHPSQFVKCKCQWYCDLHGCCTGYLYERPLCNAILGGYLDDLLPNIKSEHVRNHAIERQRQIFDYINGIIHDIAKLCDEHKDATDREIGILTRKHPNRLVRGQVFTYRRFGKEAVRDNLVEWFRVRSGWRHLRNVLKLDIENAIDLIYQKQIADQDDNL